MADELRPYEPTPRYLQRLRQEGQGPHCALLRYSVGVWLLMALGTIGFFAGPGLLHRVMRASLSLLASSTRPAPIYGAWVVGGAAFLGAAICLLIVASMLLVDGIVAGFGWKWRRLTSSGVASANRAAEMWVWGLVVMLLLFGIFAIVAWIGMASSSVSIEVVPMVALRLGILCLTVVLLLGLFDALVAYWRFVRTTRMTRREFLEEQREQRGHWLTLLRRQRRMERRRRR